MSDVMGKGPQPAGRHVRESPAPPPVCVNSTGSSTSLQVLDESATFWGLLTRRWLQVAATDAGEALLVMLQGFPVQTLRSKVEEARLCLLARRIWGSEGKPAQGPSPLASSPQEDV